MKKIMELLLKGPFGAGITFWAMGCLIVAIAYGASWIATCGIIKLVTLCFGWDFSWLISTGIWLIMVLLNMMFKKKN